MHLIFFSIKLESNIKANFILKDHDINVIKKPHRSVYFCMSINLIIFLS